MTKIRSLSLVNGFLIFGVILAGGPESLALAQSTFASPNCVPNPDPRAPCIDRAAAARAAEQRRQFEAEQARKREQARQQQIIDQQRRQQEANQRQREINDYYRRQAEQKRLAEQQREAQLNAEVRSPDAIRVQSYAGIGNAPYYIAYNNTGAYLVVYISYHLRGADGSYYNGTATQRVNARSSLTMPYYSGPVDTRKAWTIQNTNIRWERVYN